MNNEELLREILQELKNINNRLDQLDQIYDRLSEIALEVTIMR